MCFPSSTRRQVIFSTLVTTCLAFTSMALINAARIEKKRLKIRAIRVLSSALFGFLYVRVVISVSGYFHLDIFVGQGGKNITLRLL